MTSKIKSFFEKIGDWFKEIGHNTTWEQTALTALKVVAPPLETLIALTAGGAAATKVASWVTQIQNDIAGAAALLSGAQTANGSVTVTSFLSSAKSNMTALLEDADVKNSGKLSDITAIGDALISEIDAITSAIPQAAAA